MLRRSFLNTSSLVASGMMSTLNFDSLNIFQNTNKFNLKYAPHFGMFKNLAGDNLIDQLNYIADQGFTAFEDNNLKKRTVDFQEKMSKTMQKKGLDMGVFVAHTIYWNCLLYTSPSPRDKRQSRIPSWA